MTLVIFCCSVCGVIVDNDRRVNYISELLDELASKGSAIELGVINDGLICEVCELENFQTTITDEGKRYIEQVTRGDALKEVL